jgi:hypothetical protein
LLPLIEFGKENPMFSGGEFLHGRDGGKIWQAYCGFFDLSLKEFLEIQKHLLLEEIEIVAQSPLGRTIMRNAAPRSIDEFRKMVPLTTYADYAPYIGERQEELLPEKPYCWARTSGRGGVPKWVPYTERAVYWLGVIGIATNLLACASKKGEVRLNQGFRFLHNLPPRPFLAGMGAMAFTQQTKSRMIPPFEKYEEFTFEKRIEDGFKIALRTGVEVIGSLTSILLRMGERFADRSRGIKLSFEMLYPQVIYRLIRAYIRSKIEKRPILPKDPWRLKGLICYGIDTSMHRKHLMHYWGKEPLEVYGGTEVGLIATQSWSKKGATFFPFSCFFEFVPEEEWLKTRENEAYQPSTVLLDEVEAGKRYEVIVTSFYGMPFLRYRMGDLIRIVSLKDDEAGIQLPQMVFESRADDIIDIAGFTRLDEKMLLQAIFDAGIQYSDWTARKEHNLGNPILHIYMETKDGFKAGDVEYLVNEHLRTMDGDYRNLEDMLGLAPLKVTLLPRGSFRSYYEMRKNDGVELARLKPPQMNATDAAIEELLHPARRPEEKRS